MTRSRWRATWRKLAPDGEPEDLAGFLDGRAGGGDPAEDPGCRPASRPDRHRRRPVRGRGRSAPAPRILDLCAEIGVTRIECGEGFTEMGLKPAGVLAMADERGLEVEYEMGKKHGGPFTEASFAGSLEQAREWEQAGAVQIVVEGRESARGVGLFDDEGRLNEALAERVAEEFGFEMVKFEAPNKPSQFALLDLLGPQVRLSNVRLEEVLRVEIYRRGLHSDSFSKPNLRPPRPAADDCGSVPES